MSIKKLSACFIGLFFSFNGFAATKLLENYDALLQALDSGSKVRAVVHFDKCTLESGTEILTEISFGFNYEWYNHYQLPIDAHNTKEVIATSKTIFSITKINNIGSFYNYLQLHVFKDNTARFFGAMVDPKTLEQKAQATFICPVSTGVQFYGKDPI